MEISSELLVDIDVNLQSSKDHIIQFLLELLCVSDTFEPHEAISPSLAVSSLGYENFTHISALFEMEPKIFCSCTFGEPGEVERGDILMISPILSRVGLMISYGFPSDDQTRTPRRTNSSTLSPISLFLIMIS